MLKKFLVLSALICVISGNGFSQSWTTVTASNITDLNQQKLAAGQLCFLATDQSDQPISFSVGGGGQVLKRPYCSAIANGAVAAFTVPNPSNSVPAGIYYRVTVRDTSTGAEVLRYPQVTFTGATFNLDNYAPTNLGSFAPLTGTSVAGSLSVSGNLSVTGTLATGSLGAASATSYNSVCEADAQTGSDAGAKIAACIAALPSTGGVVDARGLQGAQTSAANPFASSNKPTTLLLGATTITTSACWSLPSNTSIIGAGRGISTLKLANGVNSCYLVNNLHPASGDNHIALTGLTLDGNMLNQSPTGAQRTGCVFFERVQYFWVENNELLNCYHFGLEALGQSQFGWVRNNRLDGTLLGSGILFGTGPLSTDSTGAIAEAYDMWAESNYITNTQADCLFATGSNTAGQYGTARIHFNRNTLTNCGDVSIELGDSSRDSEASSNIIQMPPAQPLQSIARSANTVTATLAAPCNQYSTTPSAAPFTVNAVTYAGATSFNGNFTLASVSRNATTCTLTWAQTGENGTGAGGSIVRTGNLALLSRSGLNHSLTGNVVNGNGAANQGCEMAWGNTGDNAPRDENVVFDNVCYSTGGTAFAATAATAGQVNQMTHRSRLDATIGNDFSIGSNVQNLRLTNNGFLSSGSSVSGFNFQQTNDLQLRTNNGNAVKLLGSKIGISTGDFNPTSLVDLVGGGNLNDFQVRSVLAANEGITIGNSVQSWALGVRNDLSQKFNLRNITGASDALLIDTAGNMTVTGGITASSLSLSSKATTYNNQATAGIGLTPVLWTVGLSGQTASISTTNITAACGAGTYSVSFYLKTTTPGTAGTAALNLNWNDGTAMTFTSSAASLTSTTGVAQGTQVIKCNAASTVSYSVSLAGATGSPQYSLDITVEQVK